MSVPPNVKGGAEKGAIARMEKKETEKGTESPLRSRRRRPTVFLDLDGVVHPWRKETGEGGRRRMVWGYRSEPCERASANLRRIAEAVPDVRFVFSSFHRTNYEEERMALRDLCGLELEGRTPEFARWEEEVVEVTGEGGGRPCAECGWTPPPPPPRPSFSSSSSLLLLDCFGDAAGEEGGDDDDDFGGTAAAAAPAPPGTSSSFVRRTRRRIVPNGSALWRATEIGAWLLEHHEEEVSTFCVLDDLDLAGAGGFFEPRRVVRTEATEGATAEDAARAVRLLLRKGSGDGEGDGEGCGDGEDGDDDGGAAARVDAGEALRAWIVPILRHLCEEEGWTRVVQENGVTE